MGINREEENCKNLQKLIEIVKWITAITILVVAIFFNCYYHNKMSLSYILLVLFLIALSGGILLLTNKGKSIVDFAREAQIEIRKVVWPTYRETLYTTVVVVLVTSVMSVILWGLDGVLITLVSFITSIGF